MRSEGDVAGAMFESFWTVIEPAVPWLIVFAAVCVVFSFPMPGRGPRSSRRDPWRGFKYGTRAVVLDRAGGRCEGGLFFGWGRCYAAASEVDHVFPHSKGGPTVVSNGQALCKDHNRRKGNVTPPWWYIRALEKRRRGYFPEGEDVRVFAWMDAEEIAARERSAARRRR